MKLPKFLRSKFRKQKHRESTDNNDTNQNISSDKETDNKEPEETHQIDSAKKTKSPLQIIYSGHRGSGSNEVQYQISEKERTPENSLSSFKKAFKDGLQCIEFDIYKSIDDQLMVSHANDLAVYSLFKKNDTQPDEGRHLISDKTADAIQRHFDISNIRTKEYIDSQNYIYHDVETGDDVYDSNLQEHEKDYQKIPTLHNLLEEVSKENIKRKDSGQPNVKLNMELKGIGTGKLVDDHLKSFNDMKSEEEKINYEDIYFLSFNRQELLDVAQNQPNANIILGVPTIHTYMGADSKTFEITDHKLNKEELDKQVLGLDKKLKEIPDRERGLDGADMSLWDIGDEVLEYYGNNKIPINIAVTPYGKTNFEHEYLTPAIDNIQKIAEIQGSHFEEEKKPFIFIKTDTPSELQKIVEKNQQAHKTEEVISAKEYVVSNNKEVTKKDKLTLYKKPHNLYTERLDNEEKNIDEGLISK
jgi:glycerophosphoryl diester phosphodiesterase